jgi:hypothetical protein
LQGQRRSASSLRAIIGDAIKEKRPATIADLANLVVTENALDEDELVEAIEAMAEDGSLRLAKPLYELESILDFLLTPTLSAWFWLAMGLTAFSTTSIFIAPTLFPLVVVRWVFGSILVLYLPGYAFVEFLFPVQEQMGQIERFAFSVTLSLCLDIIAGLVINYIPGAELRLGSIVACLAAITVLFTIAAMARKYQSIISRKEYANRI